MQFRINKVNHDFDYDTDFDYVFRVEGLNNEIVLTVEEIIELNNKFSSIIKEAKQDYVVLIEKQHEYYQNELKKMESKCKELEEKRAKLQYKELDEM